MTPISIPWTDVNSESATVVAWHVEDRTSVDAGVPLVDVETSKAALEVEAPSAGIVLQIVPAGRDVMVGEPIGYLFEDETALAAYAAARDEAAVASAGAGGGGDGVQATAKARERAAELGVDLATVRATGLVTVRDVEAAAGTGDPSVSADGPVHRPEPLEGDARTQRLLIIGAGLGATQVIDILANRPEQSAVAIVDDDPKHWGRVVRGVPVVGASREIARLWEGRAFDAAVIAISTSVDARARLRTLCRDAGIPLANVIDPTARIGSGVRLGSGNVICAFVHLGTEAEIGDNNFISAYNSFDHHNVLGSDISTGPGCMASGEVHLEDRVRLGTGIFIEPKVTLGEGVAVASGATIVRSVPAGHAVKTKVVTTAVVPARVSGNRP
jgi:acetyltransferase-like isoleucine patch superfamily enzyme